MKIYIAGPMTGLPDYNYPAFNEAAAALKAAGFEVCNPATNPAPPCGSWEGYMRLAIAQLVTCDGVALLPDWAVSKGAKIEAKLGHDLSLWVIGVEHWLNPQAKTLFMNQTAVEQAKS